MSNGSIDSSTYALIKKTLDATALRSKVSANNVANLNTKNFKASYVSFEDTLNDSVNTLELATSDPRHIPINQYANGDIRVMQDTTTEMNQDGNNVDIEHEMVNQAANALEYNAMITELNNRLQSSSIVINGGK